VSVEVAVGEPEHLAQVAELSALHVALAESTPRRARWRTVLSSPVVGCRSPAATS